MASEETQASVNETARLEAFSDGVFAIAITLLILQIRVPQNPPSGGSLAHALVVLWPSYAAYAISFITIGIMWINHHRLFTLIVKPDHRLLVLNTLLLLMVSFIPFPTAVLAEHLGNAGGRTAAQFYSGTFVFIAATFNVLWRHASVGWRLLDENSDRRLIAAQTRQYRFGPLLYVVAFLAAFVHPFLSVAINLALALFFALPPKKVIPAKHLPESAAPRAKPRTPAEALKQPGL